MVGVTVSSVNGVGVVDVSSVSERRNNKGFFHYTEDALTGWSRGEGAYGTAARVRVCDGVTDEERTGKETSRAFLARRTAIAIECHRMVARGTVWPVALYPIAVYNAFCSVRGRENIGEVLSTSLPSSSPSFSALLTAKTARTTQIQAADIVPQFSEMMHNNCN